MPYAAPRNLDEAVSLLRTNQGARVLAGGHRLLVEPHRSTLRQHLLVDLRKIPNLSGITKTADGPPPHGSGESGVKIGAMTTLSDIAADATIRAYYRILAEVAETTGDVQLRNRATIGGSLANTDADDTILPIAAVLSATIDVTGSKGSRTVAADDLFSAKLVLASDEIITALNLPAVAAKTGMAYHAHRNAATLAPISAVAVVVTLAADGTIAGSRTVLIGGAERPVRLAAAEKQMMKARGADAVAAAGKEAGNGITMRSDLFASADYRMHLSRVLLERALQQALERAGG